MKAKKIIASLLVCGMSLGCLFGCGEKQEESSQVSVSSKEESSSVVESSTSVSEEVQGPITTEPITINILTKRNNGAPDNTKDLWYFEYLEWWMNEQGYNITINVESVVDENQQKALVLGSNTVPDLVWGINLTTSEMVTYGQEDNVLLDWTPYVNEETMPNLTALMNSLDGSWGVCTAADGGMYGLPYLSDRGYGQTTGTNTTNGLYFVNTKWLEECKIEELPTTVDGYIDMLRTFKSEIKLDNGKEVIPALSIGGRLDTALWYNMGYYGTNPGKYGQIVVIKGEELYLPAATEDYRTYVETMHTLYNEKLISEDYFVMQDDSVRALEKEGVAGVVHDNLSSVADYNDWVALPIFEIGGSKVEDVAFQVKNIVTPGNIWSSASTKYPEVLAYLLDYVYSDEGSMYMKYGPQKGNDPLGKLDGWYFKDGVITNDEIQSGKGTYTELSTFASHYIFSSLYTANELSYDKYARKIAGITDEIPTYDFVDAVTGNTFVTVEKVKYTKDNADGYGRLAMIESRGDNLTTVYLPGVYMSEEDITRSEDLRVVLDEYIVTETPRFITGQRPLDEIDDFQAQLKKLGVDEYLEIMRNAYSTYLNSVFE